MADTYWQDPSGVVWFVQDGADPAVGWTLTTLAAYNTWYAGHQAFIAANKAALDAANCATRKAIYNNLKSIHAVEYSEATYRALSGFTPGDC